jgi:uncharacterized protein (TIGR03792 family)
MTVEILRFEVPTGRADEFVRRNEEVWTPALRQSPGFIGREILRAAAHADEIVIIVRWRSREDLERFPAALERDLSSRMADLVVHQEQHIYECVLPPSGEPGPTRDEPS